MSQGMNIKGLAELLALPRLSQQLIATEQMMARLVRTNNTTLAQPINRLLRHHGKHLRPVLVLAGAALQSRPIDEPTIITAAAIELIHLSSLVHDDIIDEAHTRRGQPTINQQEGVAQAILVGDFLLARASAAGASVDQAIGQLIGEAYAAMTEGQSLELQDTFNPRRSLARYLKTINQKTAVLLASAVQAGALSTCAPTDIITALKSYGTAFGMAFQLVDDVRDVVVEAAASDKPVAHDIQVGVYTLPILLGLKGTQAATVKHWLKQPERIAQAEIVKTLQADGSLTKTLAAIRRYNRKAEQALAPFIHNATAEGLSLLPEAYALKALRHTPLEIQ